MAKSSTSVYGFYFRKSLNGLEHPATMEFLLGDSAEYTIGDAVYLGTDGALDNCGVGSTYAPVGILVGIVDKNGTNIFSPRASGTTGATLTADDTVTTSSSNVSTYKIKGQVIVDPAGTCLFYNDTNGSLSQTMVGSCFDMTSGGDRVDQGTTTDGTAVFQLLEIDPDGDGDLSKGLFRINENQWFS
jgi:hypothetical protein